MWVNSSNLCSHSPWMNWLGSKLVFVANSINSHWTCESTIELTSPKVFFFFFKPKIKQTHLVHTRICSCSLWWCVFVSIMVRCFNRGDIGGHISGSVCGRVFYFMVASSCISVLIVVIFILIVVMHHRLLSLIVVAVSCRVMVIWHVFVLFGFRVWLTKRTFKIWKCIARFF